MGIKVNMMPNGEHQIISPDRSQIFDTGINFLWLRHQRENPLSLFTQPQTSPNPSSPLGGQLPKHGVRSSRTLRRMHMSTTTLLTRERHTMSSIHMAGGSRSPHHQKFLIPPQIPPATTPVLCSVDPDGVAEIEACMNVKIR